jgi:hypothetical protein
LYCAVQIDAYIAADPSERQELLHSSGPWGGSFLGNRNRENPSPKTPAKHLLLTGDGRMFPLIGNVLTVVEPLVFRTNPLLG